MKKFGIVFIIALFTSLDLISQEYNLTSDSLALKKNAIYATGGIGLFGVVDASYERVIKYKLNSIFKQTAIKFSGGPYITWENNGFLFMSGLTGLTGLKNSHAEISIGVGCSFERGDASVIPTASVGYRYQKFRGGFLFRTGISFPEFLYFGLGISF